MMFNIFLRINKGGMTLNGQEIRHAVHPGPARSYLKKLADSREFLDATSGSVNPRRMADRECVLRFLAFHIEPWEKYSTNNLDGYLGSIMAYINSTNPRELDLLTADFNKAMLAALKIFGENSFRKPRGTTGRRRPINRALFETWSVQLARCSQDQISMLVKRRKEVRRRFRRLMAEDDQFDRAVSYSTGAPRRVRKTLSER